MQVSSETETDPTTMDTTKCTFASHPFIRTYLYLDPSPDGNPPVQGSRQTQSRTHSRQNLHTRTYLYSDPSPDGNPPVQGSWQTQSRTCSPQNQSLVPIVFFVDPGECIKLAYATAHDKKSSRLFSTESMPSYRLFWFGPSTPTIPTTKQAVCCPVCKQQFKTTDFMIGLIEVPSIVVVKRSGDRRCEGSQSSPKS
jgi:hypothetical protein